MIAVQLPANGRRTATIAVLSLLFVGSASWEASASQSGQERECAAARSEIAARGAALPPGIAFLCPGSTYDAADRRTSLGLACWEGSRCADDRPKVAIRSGLSGAKLRYVITHEICHHRARLGLEGGLNTLDEQDMDRCAAAYGYPNVYFGQPAQARLQAQAQEPSAPAQASQVQDETKSPNDEFRADFSGIFRLIEAVVTGDYAGR